MAGGVAIGEQRLPDCFDRIDRDTEHHQFMLPVAAHKQHGIAWVEIQGYVHMNGAAKHRVGQRTPLLRAGL